MGLQRHRDPLPLYYQLKQILTDMIEDDKLRPGDSIPSERELSERYGISRMTVRQALTELVHEGLLYREQGRGTFVAVPKIEQGLAALTSFTEDMKQRGMTPEARLIKMEGMDAPKPVAKELGLEIDRRVMHIVRLRLADGEPMALERCYIPQSLCKGLSSEDLSGSLYDLFNSRYGLSLEWARQTLEPILATGQEAECLHVRPGAPLLLLRRVSYLRSGRPIEVVHSTYRGDRYKFSVVLHRLS